MTVTWGDEVVLAAGEADAVLERLAVRDGQLFVEGRVESHIPHGLAGERGACPVPPLPPLRPRVREEVLDLTESAAGYYDDAVKVNDFYDFSFACELGENKDMWLDLRLDSCSIPLRGPVKELARLAYALHNTRIVGDWRVCADLERSKFVADRLTGKKREAALKLLNGRVSRWKTRVSRRFANWGSRCPCIEDSDATQKTLRKARNATTSEPDAMTSRQPSVLLLGRHRVAAHPVSKSLDCV